MLQLRESLFLDKQRAVEEVRAEVEQDRRHSAFRSDERMAQVLAENADLIAVSTALPHRPQMRAVGGGGGVVLSWVTSFDIAWALSEAG